MNCAVSMVRRRDEVQRRPGLCYSTRQAQSTWQISSTARSQGTILVSHGPCTVTVSLASHPLPSRKDELHFIKTPAPYVMSGTGNPQLALRSDRFGIFWGSWARDTVPAPVVSPPTNTSVTNCQHQLTAQRHHHIQHVHGHSEVVVLRSSMMKILAPALISKELLFGTQTVAGPLLLPASAGGPGRLH